MAVALAAQDTLKNLFATLTIMADRPCSVGDLIVIDDSMGFVEDIGMRTAKLRLVEGTLVAIPNEQLASKKVENLSRARHIRRKGEIQIPLVTPPDKLQRAVEIVREKLVNHEGMDPARPPRVYLEADYQLDCSRADAEELDEAKKILHAMNFDNRFRIHVS